MMERMCYFIARYLYVYIYTPSTSTSTFTDFNMENYVLNYVANVTVVYERAYMKASVQNEDQLLLTAKTEQHFST